MGQNFGPKNVDSYKRERRYLEPDERRALLAAAKSSRWAARDYALVLLAYRHVLRCSEIIGPTRSPFLGWFPPFHAGEGYKCAA
jgi:integrase